MSGGSYNYLYCKDIDDIISMETELTWMQDRLDGIYYAYDVAEEMEKFRGYIKTFKLEMQKEIDRMRNIWRAIEMWDSYDSSEDEFKKALEEHRLK